MAQYQPEDRFRALGMKVPDLSFLQKPASPSEMWGRESLYNPRTLAGNWYEDRRAYKQICPRYTGQTITQTDYKANCPQQREDTFPPSIYTRQLQDAGEGPYLLRNTEDYCEYLQNYTTTYDLMYNWEIRRAGWKPKPWRRWKMVQDDTWFPDRDNTVSFGNLTQLGYRKAPQVPLLPNDWDVYANNPTSYQADFVLPRYPDHYVHCRRVAPREIRRENEEMVLVRAPDPCFKCKEEHKGKPEDLSCSCICHVIDAILKDPKKCTKTKKINVPYNTPRFSKFIPMTRLKQKPGVQTVYSTDSPFPYRTLKHPPHLPNGPRNSDCPAPNVKDTSSPFKKPDICTDYAGDVRRE